MSAMGRTQTFALDVRNGWKADIRLAPSAANRRWWGMEFQNRDFIQLVKRTREKFGVSIDEAHDMIR
ncbi:hypothetical protein GCM10022280_09270 [Sphingomonas swuensis]|uniref:Uncharacterized protein n=1 Tax=Sphingomonas swuensis TaxID=977800 RepID=A0ABP7SL99_9SPHN